MGSIPTGRRAIPWASMPTDRRPGPPPIGAVATPDARAVALGLDGPLREGPADVLVRTAFAAELQAQSRFQADLSLVDLAHSVVLVERGVIPPDAGARLLMALLALDEHPADLQPDPAVGDGYTNREAWLLEREPAAAWLGAGRARREATTTAFHLALRRRVVAQVAALTGFGEALILRAAAERDTLMPDYTYLQVAQPTTMGHYLLGFVGPVGRDLDRLIALAERVDRSPAGVGSGNGSLIEQDRERMAGLLGFEGLVRHGRDAIWQADVAVEAVAAALAAAISLDRLAEDLMLFASAPFGFVRLSDGHARASRVLPQKRNPFALTHARAVANRVIGHQAAVAAAGRMPTGQPDTRSVAADQTLVAFDEVTGAAELMTAVVASMAVDRERCLSALTASHAAATDLTAVIVRDGAGGVDVRTAHRIVSRVLADLDAAGRSLANADSSDVSAAADTVGVSVSLSETHLAEALDPRLAVAGRRGSGGAGEAAMTEMLADATAAMGRAVLWHAATADRIADAERALRARAGVLAERR